MIYTAVGYWNQYFTNEFSELPLFVANYGVTCPAMPGAWTTWAFWQWGGKNVPGIRGGTSNVDNDLFNGTLAELQAFARSSCDPAKVSACGGFGCSCADNA